VSEDTTGLGAAARNEARTTVSELKDDGKTFKLSVTTHADGTRSIGFDTNAMPNKVDSLVGQSESGSAENVETQGSVTADGPEPSLSDKFNFLSKSWVNTSIAFFDIVPAMTEQNFKLAEKELVNKVAGYAEEVALNSREVADGETTVTEFLVNNDELPILARILGKSVNSLQAATYVSRSALGALISEYEVMMAELFRLLARKVPNAFASDADQISLGELQRFSSMEEAVQYFVDEKIEELLHGKSHSEVLSWIEEKFKVNLSSDKKLISEFVEICQRRHLLMHAGGVVNKRYLRICSSAGCDLKLLPKLGDTVSVDKQYLRRATARVFQVGYFTIHLLWQKVLAKHLEDSVGALITASHDFLDTGLTKMGRRVCNFALNCPRKIEFRSEAYLRVNLALSYFLDKSLTADEQRSKVEEELSRSDWSVLSPTLELALACLKREFEDLANLTTAAMKDGVDYYDANSWVVFSEVRSNPDFINQFKRPSLSVS
jgi:hypothetical protein